MPFTLLEIKGWVNSIMFLKELVFAELKVQCLSSGNKPTLISSEIQAESKQILLHYSEFITFFFYFKK